MERKSDWAGVGGWVSSWTAGGNFMKDPARTHSLECVGGQIQFKKKNERPTPQLCALSDAAYAARSPTDPGISIGAKCMSRSPLPLPSPSHSTVPRVQSIHLTTTFKFTSSLFRCARQSSNDCDWRQPVGYRNAGAGALTFIWLRVKPPHQLQLQRTSTSTSKPETKNARACASASANALRYGPA